MNDAPNGGHVAKGLKVSKVTYFISGSNRAGEILGLSDCSLNVGVSINHTGNAGWDALMSLPLGSRVFVDSGAFGEVKFCPIAGKLIDKKAIKDWSQRLAKMLLVAQRYGAGAYIVAPDKVGDQVETLRRLAAYRDEVLRMYNAGAQVIVVIQKGELSAAAFADRAVKILGFQPRWGFPCKKAATTPDELADACADIGGAASVHLLGVGPCSRNWRAYMDACSRVADVSCDSVRITALVGRSSKTDRILTQLQDALVARFPCISATSKVRIALRQLYKQAPHRLIGQAQGAPRW